MSDNKEVPTQCIHCGEERWGIHDCVEGRKAERLRLEEWCRGYAGQLEARDERITKLRAALEGIKSRDTIDPGWLVAEQALKEDSDE